MKILFIAPLPPPVSGNSLAAKVFFEELIKHHEVEVANLRKESFKNGVISFQRIMDIIRLSKEIWYKKRKADVIYFTISQSVAGNIKDIFIYLLCFRSLHKMVIHLHGGGIRKLIFDKYKWLGRINKFFIRRLGAAIVLGQSHVSIFENMLPSNKIHIVPNFAEDYIFNSTENINQKFSNLKYLNVLFLSNLIDGKGYNKLIDAYISLGDDLKEMITIDFAGEFQQESHKTEFLKKISGLSHIKYHGFVSGKNKNEFLSNAHIFCLPTYYPYEGQPISILEAYAAGCVVITTNQGGICDIFKNEVNGFEVQKKSASSIKLVIEEVLKNPKHLLSIAMTNREMAEVKFRTSIYNTSLIEIIENISFKNKNY